MNAHWKYARASICGPSHSRMYLPNQDSFRIATCRWGDVAVVSDGVGSCRTSEYGSAAVCRAVVQAAKNWSKINGGTNDLAAQIHQNWLASVQPFEPKDSAATCLFVIRPAQGKIILGMLGDGLIAVLKTNDSYDDLCENKDDSFSNQTNALSERTQIQQWRMKSIDQNECCAVLLCTDGVADDLLPEKRADFMRDIYKKGQRLAAITVSRELRKMLENWPVPKHSDDMTLVFLYRYREADNA